MSAPIRVTALDVERSEAQAVEITDDYVLITAGRCFVADVQAHGNGTHVITVKNAGQGTKREVQA